MANDITVSSQPVALNLRLEEFRKFVNANASDDLAAQMVESTVGVATKTATAASRMIGLSSSAKDAAAINNTVRNKFVSALKDQFGVTCFADLPESVRQALKGKWASTPEEDFAFVNGMATSGRPLTRRRISAVLAAVEADIRGEVDVPNMAPTPAMLEERKGGAVVGDFATSVVNTLISENACEVFDKGFAKQRVSLFVKEKFCHFGEKGESYLLGNLVRDFRTGCLGTFIKLSRDSNMNDLIKRENAIRTAFVIAITAYNREHGQSAYPVPKQDQGLADAK